MLNILINHLSRFLLKRRRSSDYRNERDKHNRGVIIPVKGNEPAIDKLADFCRSRSLLNSDTQLNISFESFLINSTADMGDVFQKQIDTDLGSLTEIVPTLYELYTQLLIEAHENEADNSSQTDSSNRLYASLKRHPE